MFLKYKSAIAINSFAEDIIPGHERIRNLDDFLYILLAYIKTGQLELAEPLVQIIKSNYCRINSNTAKAKIAAAYIKADQHELAEPFVQMIHNRNPFHRIAAIKPTIVY